jgi:hypothetical protein
VVTVARTAARAARQVAIPRAVAWPRRDVVLALAWVETKKLLLHPAFLVGLGLVGAFALLVVGARPTEGSWVQRGVVLVLGTLAGLIAGTLLGANACALRAHRSRMGELFGSLPSPPESRTAAILLAVLAGPTLIATVVSVVGAPVLRADPNLTPYVNVSLMAQVPLTVLALGSFGIALARWIRHPAAAPAALVAHVMTPLVWVLPWIAGGPSSIRMGWHYTYLAAAIVFWASLALAGDRRQLRSLPVPAVALAVAIVSASFQIPPGS